MLKDMGVQGVNSVKAKVVETMQTTKLILSQAQSILWEGAETTGEVKPS